MRGTVEAREGCGGTGVRRCHGDVCQFAPDSRNTRQLRRREEWKNTGLELGSGSNPFVVTDFAVQLGASRFIL